MTTAITEDRRRFVTGGARFVANLPAPGAAYAAFVRSSAAHARIVSVDVTEAARAPGVVGVFVAADLDVGPLPVIRDSFDPRAATPLLAADVVRYAGEPLAVVVAETLAQAIDAAADTTVDYEHLPVVVDVETAALDEIILFPEIGTNRVAEYGAGDDDEELFAACDVVIRERLVNQRVAAAPMEGRSVTSVWSTDGCATVYLSTQLPHRVHAAMTAALGIAPDRMRVVAPDVGGGFGAKNTLDPEELIVTWLARRLGRPVRWTEDRSESMLGLGHGRGQVQHVELGGTADGRLLAYRLRIQQDAGAYPRAGAWLPFLTRLMACGPYDIARVECHAASYVTNTTPVAATRGAGRPEATFALERAVDLYADAVGFDPAELRRRNLLRPDQLPRTTATGATYDTGDYPSALATVLAAADYDALRAEQARRRRAGRRDLLGIGLAVYVEVTNAAPGGDYATVEINREGFVTVRCGATPYGQGHDVTWAALVADRLGVPAQRVAVVAGDTSAVPRGVGAFSSRGVQMAGSAVYLAAERVLTVAREIAASHVEASPSDLVPEADGSGLFVVGSPAVTIGWAATCAGSPGGRIAEEAHFESPPTYPFGAHLATVVVDAATGAVRLQRVVAVDDAGRIVSRAMADGQVHGGLAQGVAQALLEEVRFDDVGNPVTTNFADYAYVSAAELPSFELAHHETPSPHNPLGAKGIGESGAIGSTPAVVNAVIDALRPLGVRHLDPPTTPERVWQALRAASGTGAT